MKDYEIFSKRLKKALYHNNRMTQHDLSVLTKISEVSISRYVNGDRIPKGPEITIMARVLNVSTDYLLGLDEDMNGKEKGTIYVDTFNTLAIIVISGPLGILSPFTYLDIETSDILVNTDKSCCVILLLW